MVKVLIVEDDLMLADFTEELLVGQNYTVTGIARTVTEALALARQTPPDIVILDLRLADGGLGTEFATELVSAGGPRRPGILYVTGNKSQVDLVHGDACLAKPYRSVDLIHALQCVVEIVATGTAKCPLPQGFQLLHSVAAPDASFPGVPV